MRKKLTCILSIILILLTITVSFAWMLDLGIAGKSFIFGFGNLDNPNPNLEDHLYVSTSSKLKAKLSFQNNDNWVDIQQETEQNRDPKGYIFYNAQPGDIVRYNLAITNESEHPLHVNINLSGINIDETSQQTYDEFLNNIYIGLYITKGFYSPYNPPKLFEANIKSLLLDYNILNTAQDLSCMLLNNLVIPVNQKEEPVEMGFFIRLDNNASNAIEGKSFSISRVNIISI